MLIILIHKATAVYNPERIDPVTNKPKYADWQKRQLRTLPKKTINNPNGTGKIDLRFRDYDNEPRPQRLIRISGLPSSRRIPNGAEAPVLLDNPPEPANTKENPVDASLHPILQTMQSSGFGYRGSKGDGKYLTHYFTSPSEAFDSYKWEDIKRQLNPFGRLQGNTVLPKSPEEKQKFRIRVHTPEGVTHVLRPFTESFEDKDTPFKIGKSILGRLRNMLQYKEGEEIKPPTKPIPASSESGLSAPPVRSREGLPPVEGSGGMKPLNYRLTQRINPNSRYAGTVPGSGGMLPAAPRADQSPDDIPHLDHVRYEDVIPEESAPEAPAETVSPKPTPAPESVAEEKTTEAPINPVSSPVSINHNREEEPVEEETEQPYMRGHKPRIHLLPRMEYLRQSEMEDIPDVKTRKGIKNALNLMAMNETKPVKTIFNEAKKVYLGENPTPGKLAALLLPRQRQILDEVGVTPQDILNATHELYKVSIDPKEHVNDPHHKAVREALENQTLDPEIHDLNSHFETYPHLKPLTNYRGKTKREANAPEASPEKRKVVLDNMFQQPLTEAMAKQLRDGWPGNFEKDGLRIEQDKDGRFVITGPSDYKTPPVGVMTKAIRLRFFRLKWSAN